MGVIETGDKRHRVPRLRTSCVVGGAERPQAVLVAVAVELERRPFPGRGQRARIEQVVVGRAAFHGIGRSAREWTATWGLRVYETGPWPSGVSPERVGRGGESGSGPRRVYRGNRAAISGTGRRVIMGNRTRVRGHAAD